MTNRLSNALQSLKERHHLFFVDVRPIEEVIEFRRQVVDKTSILHGRAKLTRLHKMFALRNAVMHTPIQH